MTKDPHRAVREAIAAHFAGSGTPARDGAMRAHLPTCADCHAFYERNLLMASLDPRGLSSEVRLARGLGLPARRDPARGFLGFAGVLGFRGVLGVCGAAVAALALVYSGRGPGLTNHPHHASSERPVATEVAASPVAARGAAAAVAEARTPEIQIYRLATGRLEAGGGATVERVGDVVSAGDELAFAYRNPAGQRRLLVFAVDEHGHVYWYHPGWSDAAENPTAVAISADPGLHELRAAVLHQFDGERIMIHALFTDRELNVRQIEAAVAKTMARDPAAAAFEPLALPGTTDIVRPLRVVR